VQGADRFAQEVEEEGAGKKVRRPRQGRRPRRCRDSRRNRRGTRKRRTKGAARKKAGRKKTRGKVAPKYRNPANSRETWTGRGRKPLWVVAALESGKKLQDLAIK